MHMLDLHRLRSKYDMKVNGVVHVGAHEGQELSEYESLQFGEIIFIEPIPKVCVRLIERCRNHYGVRIFCTAISNYEGMAKFYVTNNEQSSSLLRLKEHSRIYPKIIEAEVIMVPVIQLDALLSRYAIDPAPYNFLVVDVQGAELSVFEGAKSFLKTVDYIITEINRRELYEGCALETDIDEFLGEYGFVGKGEHFPHPSWGDKFYVRD